MKLTVKEEAFVQGLFSGLSQRKSFKEAYNTDRMKDETIDVKACNLAKTDKVRIRLKELQDEVAKENKWTIERLIEAFEDNFNESKGNGDIRVSNDSLKEIGKLCGHYVEHIQSKNENTDTVIIKGEVEEWSK